MNLITRCDALNKKFAALFTGYLSTPASPDYTRVYSVYFVREFPCRLHSNSRFRDLMRRTRLLQKISIPSRKPCYFKSCVFPHINSRPTCCALT